MSKHDTAAVAAAANCTTADMANWRRGIEEAKALGEKAGKSVVYDFEEVVALALAGFLGRSRLKLETAFKIILDGKRWPVLSGVVRDALERCGRDVFLVVTLDPDLRDGVGTVTTVQGTLKNMTFDEESLGYVIVNVSQMARRVDDALRAHEAGNQPA